MKKLVLAVLIAIPAFAAETVTVRPREGLMDVSFRVYGTHSRWKEIYQWNKAVIPNPNKVEVGTVLKIERAPVAKAEAPPPPSSPLAVESAPPALGSEDSPVAENSAAPEPAPAAAPRAPAKTKPPVEKSKPLLPYTELELPQ